MVNGRYLRKAPQVVVICSKFGRLGNRLFVFAHAVAAAIEYNFLLLNPSFEDYADYFEATRGQWLVRYQPGEAPSSDVGALGSIVRHLCYQSANLILRRGVRNRLFASVPLDETQKMDLAGVDFRALLMDTRVLLLSGWLFRAEDLLAKHAEKVRRFFVPYKEHAVRIEKFMADLRKDADVVIGIHIRRGDYKEWRSGRYYFSADQVQGYYVEGSETLSTEERNFPSLFGRADSPRGVRVLSGSAWPESFRGGPVLLLAGRLSRWPSEHIYPLGLFLWQGTPVHDHLRRPADKS